MLIDAHAHLDKYGAGLDSALEEIERRRIFTWAVSMDIPSYERNLKIAKQCRLVLPTFGVHPRRAPAYAGSLAELTPWLEQSPAFGELGLDFHWVADAAQYPAQIKVLEYLLAAAREQNKLVNLHTKGAERKILDLLERYEITRAVVHWYSGPLDILGALAERGAYFTLGVELPSSEAIRQIARAVPLKQLLTETDNPGGLKWLNGTPGMPAVVLEVIDALAAVKQVTAGTIVRAVEENFRRLTAGDPWLDKLMPSAASSILPPSRGT